MNPFQQLGLMRNPFGTLTPDEWAAVAVIPPAITQALATEYHLLILGQKGHGKSTILQGLLATVPATATHAYERIPSGQRRYQQAALTTLDYFALDEAQRLAPWHWVRVLRAAQAGTRLLLGSHWNHAPLLRGCGLPMQVFHLGQLTTRVHIAQVWARRIAFFSSTEPPSVWLSDDAIAWLWEQYGTDLRAQESVLYEVFQVLMQPGAVTAIMLRRVAQP